jgi:UPF0176 protein
MPLVDQVRLRTGQQVGNKVFRKGKSENLKFKHSGDLTNITLATADASVNEQAKQKPADIRQKVKVKKVLLGKAEHYYVKAQVGQFTVENHEVNSGDKILISGPTTGNQELVLEKMIVDDAEVATAKIGDKVTFEVPFRIRLSDKIYKILE